MCGAVAYSKCSHVHVIISLIIFLIIARKRGSTRIMSHDTCGTTMQYDCLYNDLVLLHLHTSAHINYREA